MSAALIPQRPAAGATGSPLGPVEGHFGGRWAPTGLSHPRKALMSDVTAAGA